MRPKSLSYASPLLALLAVLDASSASAQSAPPAEPQPPTEQPARAPSGLVPPELTQFVEAPFPAEALKLGHSAQVLLQITIDTEGHVTDVQVQQPVGEGFDEAAQAAARQFVFRPALKDGKPVASRILYRYKFEYKAPPPPVEPPKALPKVAKLQGTVRLTQSDTPMAGALVQLRSPDGQLFEVHTDEAGHWQADQLPPGAYAVSVAAPGFRPYQVQELLGAGEALEVVYRLSPQDGPLEVTIRGERPDREITKRTIEREELARVPGTGGDALRAVQAMPSVARTTGYDGLLIVRGSSPRGTGVFVDGTWVPQIYHFGGLSSVIPTEMIEALDFYPGNFSARYGRLSGGVVDVKTREIKDNGYQGLAQVDLIDARVMLQGPVPGLKDWSFVVGGRRSHVDAWLPSLMDSAGQKWTSAPVYYDYQAFAQTRPTRRSLLRIGFFGSDDRMAMRFDEALVGDPGIAGGVSTGDSFWRLQGIYRNNVSDQLSLSLSAAYGRDTEDIRFGAIKLQDTLRSVTVRGEVAYKPVSTVTVRVGPDILYMPYEADIRAPQPPDPGQPDPGPFSAQPPMVYKGTGSFSLPGAFAEVEWQPSERAKVLLGGRYDYLNLTGKSDFSPRINARYDLRHDFPRTTIKGGAGYFYQNPQPIEMAPVFGSSNLRSNRAKHYSLGFEQEISTHVDLSVEGFYKDLDDQVVRVALEDGSNNYRNLGTGKVVGAEALLRYRPDGRFFGWVAYTLSRSTRQNSPQEPERVFEYDQTHILTVLGSYNLGRGWQLGGRFRYVTGNPTTPCLGGVLNAAVGAYACKSGELYSTRVPAFHQLDVRVDKTWRFTDWRLTTYLDLQNAYNRKNPEGVVYNYNYTEAQYQSGLPIIPNVGVRGEF